MGSIDPTAGILSGVGGMFTQMMADDAAMDRQNASYKQNSALQQQSAELQLSNWKEMQSNAHQLEIEDLKKAGLNPILSATNGHVASGGSVGTPSVSSASPQSNNSLQNAIATAVQAKQAQRAYEIQQGQLKVEQTKAETDKVNAQANLQTAISNSAKNYSDIDVNIARVKQIQQDVENSRSKLQHEINVLVEQASAIKAQGHASSAQAAAFSAQVSKLRTETEILGKDLEIMNDPTYLQLKKNLNDISLKLSKENLADVDQPAYKVAHYFGNLFDAFMPGSRGSVRVGRFGSFGTTKGDSK